MKRICEYLPKYEFLLQMDALAAGLLSTGLRPQDRVLICGSNTAHFFICSLACARADLIFSLMSPNFANAEQLKYALTKVWATCTRNLKFVFLAIFSNF